MHPLFGKTLAALLLLTITYLLLRFGGHAWTSSSYGSRSVDFDTPKHADQPPCEAASSTHWSYQWERDRNDHGLSSEQCNHAFPELYHELDRAVAYWSPRNITPETIELSPRNEGGLRVLIKDQRLRVLQTKGMKRGDFRMRIMAVLHQLQRALQGHEAAEPPFDDMEFTVVVDDWPNLPLDREATAWAFTRKSSNPNHDGVWLIPDFNFWAAPPAAGSFHDMQAEARKHDAPVGKKLPQAVWRGVAWTNPDIRLALVNLTQNQPWADVKVIEWKDASNVMALDEFCRYAYLINTEGRSWSSRLTHILNCDSVPILHDLHWVAHYYHLLQPDVNYVPVHRNFSDIEEKVQRSMHDPTAAQSVADSARQTFRERYTTPAATACYWRRLLRAWSRVAFRPEAFEVAERESPSSARKARGIAFEEFV